MRRIAHCAVAVTLFVVLLLAGLAPATATAQRRGHYTLLIENDSRYDIYSRISDLTVVRLPIRSAVTP